MAPLGVSVLDPAPAQDQNGIAVSATTAAEYDLRRISDLAPIAPQLTFGGPVECPERPLCLLGLESLYGLRFERFVPLDASGPLTADALASGQVDVALMFTTDGRIAADHFRLLADDRGLQPAENVTPFVRTDAIDRFGAPLVDVVNAVSKVLTTDDLRSLNAEVFLAGRSPAEVAASWLRDHGFSSAVE